MTHFLYDFKTPATVKMTKTIKGKGNGKGKGKGNGIRVYILGW